MKATVLRLIFVHLAVLVLAALGSGLLWGGSASWASAAGVLAFSIPLVAFSSLVLRASSGDQARFWARFMAAELFKWISSGSLLALAFVSGWFLPVALLAGFFLSVLIQVFFPIFVRKESES